MHPAAQLAVNADAPTVHAMAEVLRALGWTRECNFRDVVLYGHADHDGRQCMVCPAEAGDYDDVCQSTLERLVALHGFVQVHAACAAQHADAYLHILMLRAFETACRRTYG